MITNERKQEAVVLIRSDKKPIYIGGLTSHPESGVGPVAAHGLANISKCPKSTGRPQILDIHQ